MFHTEENEKRTMKESWWWYEKCDVGLYLLNLCVFLNCFELFIISTNSFVDMIFPSFFGKIFKFNEVYIKLDVKYKEVN